MCENESDERLWLKRSDEGDIEKVVTESERKKEKNENEKTPETEEPGESEEETEADEGPIWRGKPVLRAFFPFYFIGALGATTGTIAELAFPLPLWTLGFLIFFVALMITIPLPLQMAWTFTVSSEEIRQDFSLFVRRSKSAPLDKVTDAVVRQGPIARLLGFGSVRIDTAGTPFPGVKFWGIERPFEVKKKVRETAGELKDEQG